MSWGVLQTLANLMLWFPEWAQLIPLLLCRGGSAHKVHCVGNYASLEEQICNYSVATAWILYFLDKLCKVLKLRKQYFEPMKLKLSALSPRAHFSKVLEKNLQWNRINWFSVWNLVMLDFFCLFCYFHVFFKNYEQNKTIQEPSIGQSLRPILHTLNVYILRGLPLNEEHPEENQRTNQRQ